MSQPTPTGLRSVVACAVSFVAAVIDRETKGIDLKALDDADADELAAERQAAVG
jgi:hypothetical protein